MAGSVGYSDELVWHWRHLYRKFLARVPSLGRLLEIRVLPHFTHPQAQGHSNVHVAIGYGPAIGPRLPCRAANDQGSGPWTGSGFLVLVAGIETE